MHERIMVDVLRQVITAKLPAYCREKISYNVPFFFGHKGICIIWPAAIPRGGIKKGVLLGFRPRCNVFPARSRCASAARKQAFEAFKHGLESKAHGGA